MAQCHCRASCHATGAHLTWRQARSRPVSLGYRVAGAIINLCRGRDQKAWLFGADELHIPADDGVENYGTRHPTVQRWLNRIVKAANSPDVRLPLMLHCTSGKDRTGVATAALLSVLGIDRELIVEEYLLSDGDVRREWVEGALDGLGNAGEYFAGIDLATLQRRFLKG